MSSAGTVTLHLDANSVKLLRELQKSQRATKRTAARMRKDMGKTSSAFANVAKMARAAGLAMAAMGAVKIGRDVVRSVTSFNQAIADLSAITGAVGDDLEFLRKAAFDFGRTTTLSASQAAEGMKLVASAKPDLLESVTSLSKVTKAAITLAEAAGSTLPEAAVALAGALNQYSAGTEQAIRFTNVLAAGAKYGASEISETAEALTKVGTVAASLGIKFETTIAAIEMLSSVTIKGSEAGLGMRMVLLRLEKQSNGQFKPSVVGLTKAFQNLKAANLSTTEQMDLFGVRQITIGQKLTQLSGGFDALEEKLTGTNIAFEQQATKVNTLEGRTKGLKSAYEGLTIVVGEQVEPALASLAVTMTDMLNAYTDLKVALGSKPAGGVGVFDWIADGLASEAVKVKIAGTAIGDELGTHFAALGKLVRFDFSGVAEVYRIRAENKELLESELAIYLERLYFGEEAAKMLREQLELQRQINSAARFGLDLADSTPTETDRAASARKKLDATPLVEIDIGRIQDMYKPLTTALQQAAIDLGLFGATGPNAVRAMSENLKAATASAEENHAAMVKVLNILRALDAAGHDGGISLETYNRQMAESVATLTEGIEEIALGPIRRMRKTLQVELDKMNVYAEQAARNIQDAFARWLFDPFDKGLKGMLKGFLDVMRQILANQMAASIFKSLDVGSKGGWLDKLFGSGKAAGGYVSAGTAYPVGERGPELFVPGASGTIIPNHKLERGGGNSFTFITNVESGGGNDPQTLIPLLEERDRKLKGEFLDELNRGTYA